MESMANGVALRVGGTSADELCHRFLVALSEAQQKANETLLNIRPTSAQVSANGVTQATTAEEIAMNVLSLTSMIRAYAAAGQLLRDIKREMLEGLALIEPVVQGSEKGFY